MKPDLRLNFHARFPAKKIRMAITSKKCFDLQTQVGTKPYHGASLMRLNK